MLDSRFSKNRLTQSTYSTKIKKPTKKMIEFQNFCILKDILKTKYVITKTKINVPKSKIIFHGAHVLNFVYQIINIRYKLKKKIQNACQENNIKSKFQYIKEYTKNKIGNIKLKIKKKKTKI